MSAQISAQEMVQSLTGFEEIAIEQQMKIDPYMDGDRKPMQVLRALVFVQKKREGVKDSEARKFAMEMPMSELQARFVMEAEDGTEDLTVTASGEDSAPSV